MEPEPPGATFFCLESEPTQFGRSRSQSRLQDLGLLEPEPPKKVAAPQHWNFQSANCACRSFEMSDRRECYLLQRVRRAMKNDSLSSVFLKSKVKK